MSINAPLIPQRSAERNRSTGKSRGSSVAPGTIYARTRKKEPNAFTAGAPTKRGFLAVNDSIRFAPIAQISRVTRCINEAHKKKEEISSAATSTADSGT
jgi:hypothetical protein